MSTVVRVAPLLRAPFSLSRSPLVQLPRFAASGGLSNLVYALVTFAAAGSSLGVQPVHLVATVLSTATANELHRRFTFRGGERPGFWRAQSAGGAMAVVGFVASGFVLAVWHSHVPSAGPGSTVFLVWTVTALVGLVNFVLLRNRLGAQRSRS